ncbi:MAG: GAF domain-containing protein [Firmicutes bacterium]|nr:GAF domain-containing protein [Bacillota bacterium]
MTTFFPFDDKKETEGSKNCYHSCFSLLETVSALTGLMLAVVSPENEPIACSTTINEFCNEINRNGNSETLRKECISFHEQLFRQAISTGQAEFGTCRYNLKSFVLPLKTGKEIPEVFIAGGHYFPEVSDVSVLCETLPDDLKDSKEEIKNLYKKSPTVNDIQIGKVTERLNAIADLYHNERKRESQEARFTKVASFISDVASQLSGEINLKDLLFSINEKVCSTYEMDQCSIALWDEKRQFVEIYASNSIYADEIIGRAIKPGDGATGIVAETGEAFYSYDAENDSRLNREKIKEWGIKSLLSVPLRIGSRVTGCMHLVSNKERRMFHKQEVEFAEALGAEVAIVIDAARLYNLSQKKALDLAKSRDELKSHFIRLGAALSNTFDVKQLLKIIAEISCSFINSDAGSIYLIEDKKLEKQVTVTRAYGGEAGAYDESSEEPTGSFMASFNSSNSMEINLSPQRIKSYLGIPLSRQGQVKGLLNIFDFKEREYKPEQVEMLSFFADHAALAIDNAKIFEHEQKKAREATILYHAAKSIGESVELSEVLRHSADQLTKLVGVDRCLIMLLDSKKLEFYVSADKGLSDEQKEFFSLYKIPIDEINEELWRELVQGKPILLSGSPINCPAFEKFFKVFPTNSCLLAPLFTKEQLNGLIYLDDSRLAHLFTEAQIRLVMTIALQIASAIQRGTLVNQLEGNLDQLKALHQVSTAVTGTLSLPKVFELIVDKASHLIEAPAASIITLEEKVHRYEMKSSIGLTGDLADPTFHEAISAMTAKRRRYLTYYVSTSAEPEEPFIVKTLESAGMGGYISVPLIARKRVVGVLNCFCKAQDKFDSQEIRLLRSFANQAAIAVENASLYNIIKNKVRELATVFEVGKSITSTLELDKVLEEVCSSIASVMGADAVSIMNLDEENQQLEIVKTMGLGKYYKGEMIKVGAGIAGIAAKTGRPMVLHDQESQASPYKFPQQVKKDGLRTILSVPLKVRNRIMGLINIYKRELFHFSTNEINLLSTLANQAAVAIENARLYNEQYKIAQIIQRNLMPQVEMNFDGIDVGSVYIPSEILSGDYFEIIQMTKTRYGLVISDVSGKGTEAAIYNARAKYILRSYAMADYSPSEILTLINQMMEEETAADKFISLLYIDLDLEADEIIVSSAGHEPLIHWDDSEKEAYTIKEPSNMPIGVFPETTYDEKLYRVSKGDILLLYTDGITEARSREGEFFGTDRLLDLVRNNFHLDAQGLASKIHTAVQKFTRRKITDDFSLLVVKI